jgi:hypothetical protein
MGKIANCDINNADETGLFFSLQLKKTFSFGGNFCHDGIKSKWWVNSTPHTQF